MMPTHYLRQFQNLTQPNCCHRSVTIASSVLVVLILFLHKKQLVSQEWSWFFFKNVPQENLHRFFKPNFTRFSLGIRLVQKTCWTQNSNGLVPKTRILFQNCFPRQHLRSQPNSGKVTFWNRNRDFVSFGCSLQYSAGKWILPIIQEKVNKVTVFLESLLKTWYF